MENELAVAAGKSSGVPLTAIGEGQAGNLPEAAVADLSRPPEPRERANPGGSSDGSAPVPHSTGQALFDAFFIHPRKLLPQFPSVTADEPTTARIRSGRTVNLPELTRARQVKVFTGQRELIAIATRVAGTLFHARIVLCATDTPTRS